MRREDIDYITNHTRYNVSLLVSLGYDVELAKRLKNKLNDLFLIREGGELVIDKHLKRRELYGFARGRHKNLRLHAVKHRKILFNVD